MSIQWTFIAGYLYFEIAVVVIMIMPIFSPRRWNQFFKSRLFDMFKQHTGVYFYVLQGVLGLFLVDAVREMKKYSHSSQSPASHTHLSTEMKESIKLFRAQRNFYITGFAIFLSFVIRRLISMLIIQDELFNKADRVTREVTMVKQATSTAVMANNIQEEERKFVEELKHQLNESRESLKGEQVKVRELEEEVSKWRLKYEEVSSLNGSGQGDEKM